MSWFYSKKFLRSVATDLVTTVDCKVNIFFLHTFIPNSSSHIAFLAADCSFNCLQTCLLHSWYFWWSRGRSLTLLLCSQIPPSCSNYLPSRPLVMSFPHPLSLLTSISRSIRRLTPSIFLQNTIFPTKVQLSDFHDD